MATKINTTTTKSGITIPSGLIVQDAVHFPVKQLSKDKDGNVIKKSFVTADLIPFANEQVYFDTLGKENLGKIDEIPTSFVKELTPEDYTALAGTNALGVVQGWIKDYIETFVGEGNCEIIEL